MKNNTSFVNMLDDTMKDTCGVNLTSMLWRHWAKRKVKKGAKYARIILQIYTLLQR